MRRSTGGAHEALRQLCDATKALELKADFREWTQAEIVLTRRMAHLVAEAREIDEEHDSKMKRLYS
jgi:hypothetical protein